MFKTRYNNRRLTAFTALLFVMSLIILSAPVFADFNDENPEKNNGSYSDVISLDGSFDDWEGMPEASDGQDETAPESDIVLIKWFPDVEVSKLYLYCERLEGLEDRDKNPNAVDWDFQVKFSNGMDEPVAFVHYHPESQQVEVDLYDGKGELVWRGKGKWGEDKYTAKRVELYIPLDYIAGRIETGFQFDLSFSSQSDSAPDSGNITISTADTFPWAAAVLMPVWVALLVFFHSRKMHFFKFIAGSIGLFIFAMLFVSDIGERFLENAITWSMWIISYYSDSFSVYPGHSLVTVYHGLQAVSYLIDYECSGFIELLVYLCLMLFYPLFGFGKRIVVSVLGGLFIFASNLVRLLFIGLMISVFGTPVFFLSHTVFARLLFFGLMVILYYFVFTRQHIRKQKVGDLSYD